MTTRQEEFQQRLLATFRVEAEELVQTISTGLIALEKSLGSPEEAAPHAERTFRAAHSLKGAARAVDLNLLEGLCQVLESLLRDIKRGSLAPGKDLFDLLHEGVSAIPAFLEGNPGADQRIRKTTEQLSGFNPAAVPGSGLTPSPESPGAVRRTVPGPGMALAGPPVPAGPPARFSDEAAPPPAPPPPRPSAPEDEEAGRAAGRADTEKTVRIPSGRLDKLLEQTEELLYIKLAYQEKTRRLGSLGEEFQALRRQWRERLPGFRSLCRGNATDLSTLTDFMDWNDEILRKTEHALRDFHRGCLTDFRTTTRQIDEHLEDMRETVMLPFASLTFPLPKMTRDLAMECKKEVELHVEGDDIRVDKRILDDLRTPLTHLIRNCVDHGIELAPQRRKAGKPGVGRITVSLERKDSRRAVLTVADDGAGIDLARIREKACALNMASETEAAAMSEGELLDLIFRSEFSTAALITNLSGRGLGLAIVREGTERLGGTVSVDNRPGRGVAFRLEIPLSVSTMRGLILSVGGRRFILPTRNLEHLVRRKPAEIRTMENREAIQVDGRWLSWVHLREVLGIPPAPAGPEPTHHLAFLLRSGETRIAFRVDDISGEEEILLKSLGKLLIRVRNITGAAVMGSGEIVPVLNPDDLVQGALRFARGPRSTVPAEATEGREAPSILVADDSITSRVLLKNILEASGFRVTTAIDGQDAWIVLKESRFDGVVTDVEMPRMNGFDLTARIRQDPDLSRLPVILVTALESPDDRERGIDVGASAYIVKSNFDQSNLLDVLRRLL